MSSISSRSIEQAERGVEAAHLVADRVEELGLPEADPSVEEERAVGRARQLRHRLAGGLGKLVGAADHERLERVAGGQLVPRGRHALRREGRRALGLRVRLDGDLGVDAEETARGGRDRVRVVLPDPVARVRVGREDPETVAVQRDGPTGAQPRIEGGLGHLTFESGEQPGPQRVMHELL